MATAETMEPAPEAEPAAEEQPAAEYESGPARSDLDRFVGLYSVSDLAFEYADSWTQIRMDFQAGSDGSATGMTHDREDILPSPLTRIGPVPPEVCTTC